jgi:hypothetical protein
MKMLSLLAAMAAILLFTSSTVNKRYLVKYHFNGGSRLSDAKDASKYEIWDSPLSDCGGPSNLPCLIQFDNNIYPTLQDYLDSFASTIDVKNNAISTRRI